MATTTASASAPQPHSERTYHNTKATYALPNDNIEHARLEDQAERLRALMNNQLIHAPLVSPSVHKALDIGCGTGTITHEIASEFPNAQVYGLDLSPVPNIREKLQNIEYIQANFNDVTSPDQPDDRFEKGSFDYIFSRLLVLGMADWRGYIERCAALAKPGGWVEMHDLDISVHRVPDPMTHSQREALHPHSITLSELSSRSHAADALLGPCDWTEIFAKLCTARGMALDCGRKIPHMFVEAGLENIQIKRYMYPMSVWEGLTDAEEKLALHHRDQIGRHMPEAIKKVGQSQDIIGKEEVERACEGAREENELWDRNRGFIFMYTVCGRKPVA